MCAIRATASRGCGAGRLVFLLSENGSPCGRQAPVIKESDSLRARGRCARSVGEGHVSRSQCVIIFNHMAEIQVLLRGSWHMLAERRRRFWNSDRIGNGRILFRNAR